MVEPEVIRESQIRTQAVPPVSVTPAQVITSAPTKMLTSALVNVAVETALKLTRTQLPVPAITWELDVTLNCAGFKTVEVKVNAVLALVGNTVVEGPTGVNTVVVGVKDAHTKGSF
jgi:hypothetical protein